MARALEATVRGHAVSDSKRPIETKRAPRVFMITGTMPRRISALRLSLPLLPAHLGVETGPATTIRPPACWDTQVSKTSICSEVSLVQSASKAMTASYLVISARVLGNSVKSCLASCDTPGPLDCKKTCD